MLGVTKHGGEPRPKVCGAKPHTPSNHGEGENKRERIRKKEVAT